MNLKQNNEIIYLLDHLVKQSIINILLHHTMIPKSKFLSKFPISKWSFVNYELFKSPKLTKYIFLVNNFFATRLFSPSIQLFCEKNYLLKSLQQDCSHHQFNCFVWEKLSPQKFATRLFPLSIQLFCVRKTISSKVFLLMTHTSVLEICSSSNFLVL